MQNTSTHKPSTRTEKDILGLVHSDICGPMQNASLGGASYFATFTDDKTRYTQVTIRKYPGKRIKRLRTDNAKEYVSKNFSEFLKKEGISRELSVEYTPQQNGVAERANRTLVEMARCMMVQSRVPTSLWAEAVNTACYIRNRCSSKHTGNKTPYELWTGKQLFSGQQRP